MTGTVLNGSVRVNDVSDTVWITYNGLSCDCFVEC